MESMQGRILGLIESTITEAGFDAVQNGDWGNTGHIYGMKGLQAVIDVRYDFQVGYCNLSMSGSAVTSADLKDSPPEYRWETQSRGGPRAEWHHLNYTDGDRLEAMVMLLRGVVRATRVKVGS